MSLHTLFLDIEASKGNGEDSHLIYDDDCFPFVVLGAFDGLGGRAAGFEGMTGGRIASREATKITRTVLEESQGRLNQDIATKLQDRICQSLKSQAESKMVKSRLSGTLTGKRLCTTIALASIPRQIELESRPCEISLAWMGDSRIYFLSPQNGLQQLTRDDLEVDKDAFEMIREDPPMSQYLTADIPSNWAINFLVKNIEEKGCILVCTDGCFQYLPAPWELEKLLLKTLVAADTFQQWNTLLSEKYEYIKQDDVSLILYNIGFSYFDALKKSYQQRLEYLDANYNSEASENTLSQLWNSYRCNYEARLNAAQNISTSSDNYVDNIKDQTHGGTQASETLRKEDDRENSSINNGIDSATSKREGWKGLIVVAKGSYGCKNYKDSVNSFNELKETGYSFKEEESEMYAHSLLEINKFEEALLVCNTIYHKNHNNAFVCYFMGRIYHVKYLLQNAKKNLERAINLYPNEHDTSRNLPQFQQIKIGDVKNEYQDVCKKIDANNSQTGY
jgi:serine/threonine protein phosphatase PrpC